MGHECKNTEVGVGRDAQVEVIPWTMGRGGVDLSMESAEALCPSPILLGHYVFLALPRNAFVAIALAFNAQPHSPEIYILGTWLGINGHLGFRNVVGH